MLLRLLEYFVTLVHEEHFARAAEACHVTQPTLSAGIAALEEQLGSRLIVRDRRYIGLTAEGRAILPWARQAVAVREGIERAIQHSSGVLQGEARLGVIPAAMPAVGYLARAIRNAHPALVLSIRSHTSREIERGLAAFELDAGVTYLDNEPPANVRPATLYAERYVFVTHAESPLAKEPRISWKEAIGSPLCLLHLGMQNRRILDAHLATMALSPDPRATANSYVALLAMVEAGGISTIVPDSYAAILSGAGWARLIPFAEPQPVNRIGLVVPDRNPLEPLAAALMAIAGSLDLPPLFNRVIDGVDQP